MRLSVVRWLIASAALGLVVPLVLLVTEGLVRSTWGAMGDVHYVVSRVMRVVWPSSYWLMATMGIEGTGRGSLFVAVGIFANVVADSVVGVALCGVKHILSGVKQVR